MFLVIQKNDFFCRTSLSSYPNSDIGQLDDAQHDQQHELEDDKQKSK